MSPTRRSGERSARECLRGGENAKRPRDSRARCSPSSKTEISSGFGFFTLGEVLELNGDVAEAGEAFERAFESFDRKGFTVMAERVRARREALLLQLDQ